MPVRFILGRSGSGKTRRCLEQIESLVRADPLGPPIFFLVPKQATFQAERLLTCRLGAFARVRVVSFDALAAEILDACGAVGIPEITSRGRRLVVGHLLRRHQDDLLFYRASARRPGLAAELDATFEEFERAGLEANLIADAVQSLDHADDDPGLSLHDKLHDVNLLLGAYNQFIGQDRLDPQRRLKLVLERVADCAMLELATLFVDDFFEFSGYQTRLLSAVAAAVERAEIALLIDPDSPVVSDPMQASPAEMSTFHRTERTYRALRAALADAAAAIEDSPVLLREQRRFEEVALTNVDRNLFEGTLDNAPTHALPRSTGRGSQGLEFLDAPDVRAEVDAVARRIRAAIQRDGLRLRDIVVLVRDLHDYHELIDASFGEHGLPYFVDRRRTAMHHPLLQFIRSALLIARHNWSHDAVMTLLKTGLAGVSDDEADELENYVIEHRIRGGAMWTRAEPWGFHRNLLRAENDDGLLPVRLTETSRIDALRRGVAERLSPFVDAMRSKAPLAMRQMIAELQAMLERFDVRHTLGGWMTDAERAGKLEQRGEHEQVWAEMLDLLRQMSDLLGDEPITLPDFLEVLDSGLESFDLALTPPTVDQILVGQIDRTRTPPGLKLAFVLGLNEGVFPHVDRPGCVLSDRERRTLGKRKIDLDPGTERRLLDERYLAYFAFTRASRGLVVSRPLADAKGHGQSPSTFWNELRRIVPDAPIEHIPRASADDPANIGTPRQLMTALARWVRRGPDQATPDSPWPPLYQWLATTNVSSGAIDLMRQRAWSALRYDNTATALPPELAAGLFPLPLSATVNRLEDFAACPFRHFVKYGLQLQSRDEPDVTAIDLSNVYHLLLEQLLRDVLEARQDWCELDPAVTGELIRTHAAEIGRTLRNELMISTARNRYILDHIERTLAQAVEAQREMHRRGKYRPAFAGLRFADDTHDATADRTSLPAHRIGTPGGHEVRLRGQIDRVDLHANGRAFTIVDYKLGAGPLMLDRVYHGLSLQLLAYVLVVQAGGEKLAGHKMSPAAAFLMRLLRSPMSVDHPEDVPGADHPDFHLRVKPRGIIDARATGSLDTATDKGFSPVFQFHINKDGRLGRQRSSDTADQAEFAALLRHVERRIGEMADRIVGGDISIRPYWISRQTPCPRCAYRSVCRFEPGSDRYRMLQPMPRDEVLAKVTSPVPSPGTPGEGEDK
jgi:ATP-dependent helicase/nuclease subunit B